MQPVKSGGGWRAILYTWQKSREAGGLWRLWKAMRSKNACKTCALGMGGQKGGMVNERGTFPEVCKKSLQAMVADMQGAIPADFFETYSIPQMRAFTPRELEAAGRLTQPMLLEKGKQHYRPIGWDEAIERIASKLKSLTPEETFWYFSGRSSNEAGFLLQLFARLYGTNNVNNCSYYCHQASGVGLNNTFGTGTATLTLEDVEHADLVFLIGGNPSSNHPRLMSTLKHVRRKGGHVIVINPVIEPGLVNFSVPSDPISLLFGTKIASLYVQPHIGGDLALLTAVGKCIVDRNAHDEAFLESYCNQWPELKSHLAEQNVEELAKIAGATVAEIEQIADMYAKSNKTVFSWTMGITHHANGVENVEAIGNLACLRGMVGKPHTGMMPIRGHSNVQGIGSVGVTPKLKDAIFERLQSDYGLKLPETIGLDTLGCMEAAERGEIKFGLCLGGNLFGSNPDSDYARDALSKLEMLVTLSTTLNTGHAHATADETLILPVLARDEEPEPTTQESMFNFVRLSSGGKPRHTGPLSEIAVISRMASETLGDVGPVNWSDLGHSENIRSMIGTVVPGYEKIREIGSSGKEFQIDGRTFHAPKFSTPTGKAQLHVHHVNPRQQSEALQLMTVRSEGQFNTVVYEDYDLYRGIDRRDVILLHPDDISRLRLTEKQQVSVKSPSGQLDHIYVYSFPGIKAGNALMYYPEANVLVPRTVDPRSKTPAFKGIAIEIVS